MKISNKILNKFWKTFLKFLYLIILFKIISKIITYPVNLLGSARVSPNEDIKNFWRGHEQFARRKIKRLFECILLWLVKAHKSKVLKHSESLSACSRGHLIGGATGHLLQLNSKWDFIHTYIANRGIFVVAVIIEAYLPTDPICLSVGERMNKMNETAIEWSIAAEVRKQSLPMYLPLDLHSSAIEAPPVRQREFRYVHIPDFCVASH